MKKRTITLGDFAEINPKVSLQKGQEYAFVPMENITPGRRYLSRNVRTYTGGGAKFKSGDTLFARITPCLENGKIAQFTAAENQVGFGSTEYFVFRGRAGVSDSDYLFYLVSSAIVREPAIKSMSGASGRQRAEVKSIQNVEVLHFPLPTQRKIAALLGAYDDLIENNARRLQVLEAMAQAIYREWFVEMRFPGHENATFIESKLGRIPQDWEVKTVKDLVSICRVPLQTER